MTHRANTLGAEANLAADASHVWASDTAQPGEFAPEIARIACGAYGGINRSSDPLIGLGVGNVVAAGGRVTLTDPIGLYIATADISGLRGPQGQPVGNQARRVIRGSDDPFDPRILRFEVRLPTGTPFNLEDCMLAGRRLLRGGQIARQTTVHLYANVYPAGGDTSSGACSLKVCRHPQRTELFLAGGIAAPCPTAASVTWLQETPFEGDTGIGGPALETREPVPSTVTSSATVLTGPALAKSRAPLGS